jgi:cycloeucalenol cycloisomerase
VQRFTELENLLVGLVSTVPAFLIPLFLVGKVCGGQPLVSFSHHLVVIWLLVIVS